MCHPRFGDITTAMILYAVVLNLISLNFLSSRNVLRSPGRP
jgi:hypothetical protein